MADLRGLIERCEKATEPDRELDGDLHEMAYGEWLRKHGYVSQGETGYFSPTPPVQGAGHVRAPEHYTDSVDAALALVEKMRPGYRWGVSSVAIKIGAYPDGKTAYGEGFRAHVTKNSPLRPMPSTADAPTPALAIILALLRSLDTDNKGAAHGAP